MIKLERGKRPDELTDEVCEELKRLYAEDNDKAVWNSPKIKKPLKEAMLEMSHKKCSYCECRLEIESKDATIDHFLPKSKHPDKVVEWENLFPSCLRCNRKKNNREEIIVNPCENEPREYLGMPSNADMQNASHVRSIMRKLGKVAEQNACAIVMIGHMTKSTGGKRLYRGLGSIDIAAICRSVLMISRDEQNPEIRYMYQVKSNLAPESNAVGFVMSSEKGFQWIGKCNIDKKAEVVACSRKVTKKEKASEYLKIMLSVEDVPSADVIRRMDMIGIKERTIRTVQKEMGVQAYRKQGIWYWHMPEQEEEVDEE